jgi:hypothetical protein
VAETALCRKSTAVEIAIDDILTTSAIADISSERLTKEFLYSYLSNKDKLYNDVLLYADELETLLSANAYADGLFAVLTSLYGCPNSRDYKTKNAGVFKLKNVCINLLGATTPNWMSENMPSSSIEGGFTGRVIFVVAEEPRGKVAFPKVTKEMSLVRKGLINWVIDISNLRGEFIMSAAAIDLYTKWYNKSVFIKDARLNGYYARRGTHVFKVAMVLLAASKPCNMVIELEHVREAIFMLENIEPLMGRAFFGSGGEEKGLGKTLDRVLRMIERYKKIDHSELLNRLYPLSARELKDSISTLEEGKKIKASFDGRKRVYEPFKE